MLYLQLNLLNETMQVFLGYLAKSGLKARSLSTNEHPSLVAGDGNGGEHTTDSRGRRAEGDKREEGAS